MAFTWDVPARLAYKRSRVPATRFDADDQLAEELADFIPVARVMSRAAGAGTS
jgi:hypothetical protein